MLPLFTAKIMLLISTLYLIIIFIQIYYSVQKDEETNEIH